MLFSLCAGRLMALRTGVDVARTLQLRLAIPLYGKQPHKSHAHDRRKGRAAFAAV